ncbi:hypothetical protein hmeg3_08800 [Herbaspirillum sp. meg3]|uniref:hypothetical protein n=1 Tax=Herbaspirillum sp. meg3 TaxID=2025949 RepID=UPI000B99364A|nr:hypothetical protein [Herbaspirillum sp. meg3]ASU41334.1 hypothetical protein hmeg3_08800 [Herbaspirillum sp. meg3]
MQLFFEYSSRRVVTCALGLLALLPLSISTAQAAEQAYGTPGQPTFDQRYPSGSIQSTDAADEILLEADKERQVINDQYIDEQRACYKKFFVSSCLEAAKERNRVAVRQVRDVEVEANAYKRQAKADDRDKSLAEQHAKDEQDAARRAQDQKEKAAASARKIQESAAKQKQVAERETQAEGQADVRVKAHEAQVRKTQAEEAAKAPQRAANEQAYKEKVKQAEVHRKEVEAKKAEKERERAAKQQTPAAAPAATPLLPASPATTPSK